MKLFRLGTLVAAALVMAAGPGCGDRYPGTVEGRVYRVGARPSMPAADLGAMKAAGMDAGSFKVSVSNREGMEIRKYAPSRAAAGSREVALKAAASIDALAARFASLTLRDVISTLGQPEAFEVYDAGKRGIYFNAYYGNVDFFSKDSSGKILEIRLQSSGRLAAQLSAPVSYRFKNALGIGSRLDDVFALLGPPTGTIDLDGAPIDRDRTLQVAKSGDVSYIKYAAEGVRFFSSSGIVDSMYLFQPIVSPPASPASPAGTAPAPGAKDAALPAAQGKTKSFDDVRNLSLPAESSPRDIGLMRTLWFSTSTVFAGRSSALAERVLEDGRNPGLGVRALHAEGFTGRGVSVGIIDQNLPGTDHPEYVGKVVKYRDFGTGAQPGSGSMHGPAVLSLLVGERAGTAPGARVYYAAAPSWSGDAKYYAEALDWMIEESGKLPRGKGIRVVSVSAAPSGKGSPFSKNGSDWDKAVKRAAASGILVLDCTTENGIVSACFYDPDEPEDVAACTPGWSALPWRFSPSDLLAPTSYRSSAEAYGTLSSDWQYTGSGGLSWGIPWAAGVLALGWQADPALGADEIVELLRESAYVSPEGARIIDPRAFISSIRKGRS
jgi:serine protease AprX